MVTIDGFEIDCAIREEHLFQSDVTEHPVESGSDIADHIRPKPPTVSIEGVVSDDPIGPIAGRRGDLNASGRLEFSPTVDALAFLKAIYAERRVVTIVTGLGTYEDMALPELSIPRDAKTGAALRFMATFRQVRFVTNERTTVSVAVPLAAKKADRGHRPAPLDKPGGALDPAKPKNELQQGRADVAQSNWQKQKNLQTQAQIDRFVDNFDL
jgi:hypothetical protein